MAGLFNYITEENFVPKRLPREVKNIDRANVSILNFRINCSKSVGVCFDSSACTAVFLDKNTTCKIPYKTGSICVKRDLS